MYRRIVFLSLGVLECLVAIIVVVFAWGMPGADEVHDGVARIRSVTEQMSGQLARLRAELETIREQRPKVRALAENVRTQMATATAGLEDRAVDYVSVERLESSMGDLANGMDGLAESFRPEAARQMAGDFRGAADQIDAYSDVVGGDARHIARLLRDGQTGLNLTTAHWPEVRGTLTESAKTLRVVQAQMQSGLAHRDEYQKDVNQVVVLAQTYAAALPVMTEQIDDQLRDQEESLQNLTDSIDRTTAMLPEWDRTASRILGTARLLLLFLMGAMFGLHGSYVAVTAWGRRRVVV